MSILICGASSTVGRDLCDLLDRENIDYDGTFYRCCDRRLCERTNMFRVDFTNMEEVATFFYENKHRWRVCVFLVAERNLELCEKNWNIAMRINVDTVDSMSALCAKEGIYFIHLSTDYVFDGTSQPCFATSNVNPIQNYGISKFISECRVQRNYTQPITLSSCLSSIGVSSPNYCIIRTPTLYTSNPCSFISNNTITSLARHVMDLRHTNATADTPAMTTYVDDYEIYRPLYIPDLCIFIRVIAMVAIDNLTNMSRIQSSSGTKPPKFSGIYHFYNPDNRFTRFQMTKAVAKFMGLSHLHVVPSTRPVHAVTTTRYPYDPQLYDARYNIRNYFTHTFEETIPHIFSRYKHPPIGTSGGEKGGMANSSSFFLMFNLDDTLVHTCYAHYRSYLDVFRNRGLSFMSYSEWRTYIYYKNIHTFLENVALDMAGHDTITTERIIAEIQNEKHEAFKIYAPLYVTPTKNALDMLRWIEKHQDTINAVIVANCSQEIIDVICDVVPELHKITNWYTRETAMSRTMDTINTIDNNAAINPKKDIYVGAKEMFYKQEQYTIGFENTYVGYESLHETTPIIYFYIDENETSSDNITRTNGTIDAFIFNDYRVFTR